MAEQDLYTVTAAARRLNVSVSSIRRWGDDLAKLKLLSDTASAKDGQREYTEGDLKLIYWAIQQKQQGELSKAEVLKLATELNEGDLPADIPLEGVIDDAGSSQSSDLALQSMTTLTEPLYALLTRLDTTDDMREEIHELSERLSRIEKWIETLPGILKRRY